MNKEEKLKSLMVDRFGSVKEFSRRADIPYTTLRSILERGVGKANVENIISICRTLGITTEDLMEENMNANELLSIYTQLEQPRQHNVYTYAEDQLNEQNTVQEEISVYGGVAANPTELTYGDPIYDEKITTDVPKGADGAVTIHGDSMEDFLYDGDIAFFERQPDVENGEIAIVEIDGSGVTCKKVVKEDGKIILRSLNKKYDDRVIEKEKVRIIGKVVK